MQRRNEWYHVVGLLFAVALILFGGATFAKSLSGFDWLVTDTQGANAHQEVLEERVAPG